jgi:competence protein ComEC
VKVASGIIPLHSRAWLVNAGIACLAALAITGWRPGWIVLSVVVVAHLAWGRSVSLAVVVVVALPTILFPAPTLPVGAVSGELLLTTDPIAGAYGMWALGSLGGVPVFADLDEDIGGGGQAFAIEGEATGEMSRIGGSPRQIVRVDTAEPISVSTGLYLGGGIAVRRHVVGQLSGGSEARGLLAGFLVGDTTGVGEVTVDEMRKAGLSHFVAVSGSNVALFLGFVAAVTLPLGIGPKRRALAGLLALPVFVVATGYEPSVVRASAMAALVLGARLVDVVLEVWQVVALATIAVLAYDPLLIRSVGFQLSVVATCGVVAGARWPGPTGRLTRALSVTLGAQLAVAPLLIWHFGSVPLLSPLSNLVAAPIVSLATLLGIVGVTGLGIALVPAERLAGAVIDIAQVSAGLPQLGWMGLALVSISPPLVWKLWKSHPGPIAVAASLALVVVLFPGRATLEAGEVAVLDIGQGDAILVSGGGGRYALVDGGGDQSLLLERLREFGIRHLELVVMTHGDADHAGGLEALPGRIGIGTIWERGSPHVGAASDRFLRLASQFGIPTEQPQAGTEIVFGEVELRVIAPERRFASPNDQSIVLMVIGADRTMLLTGDIQVVGQADLPQLRVDVLKVPHHGAGTTDPDWLASTGAEEAVISVGANDFGHPVRWVIEVLEESGAVVRRTDIEGTILVDLNG